MKKNLLEQIRAGAALTGLEEVRLIAALSMPAVFAQISTVIMQYADQSMVGQLGAESSAAIGLVSSTTWLVGGLCQAANTGFTVQVAHRTGAGKEKEARGLVRHGLLAVFIFGSLLSLICLTIGGRLPVWLGGKGEVVKNASRYFRIYAAAVPIIQLSGAAAGMLQCSGNMRVPSALNIFGCFLNVLLNYLFIFPTREITIFGRACRVPGAGLQVAGAALGTAMSQALVGIGMLWFLLKKSESLHLRKGEHTPFSMEELRTAIRIGIPIGVEQAVMGFGYVMATRIVSPLGNIALAANSFAITAESLCYMPGYGISAAATTLVGQSLGAGRIRTARRLGVKTVLFGMLAMTGTGILLYVFAPQMMGFLTKEPAIRDLGVEVLRIEAFAEPMFAASIVATGVFRGAGDTLGPSVINFFSMWLVRLTLAAFLAPKMGLKGVWIAMCIDLITRGALFLIRLWRRPPGRE